MWAPSLGYWGINDKSLMILQHIAGATFTSDCFASSTNARCSKFYSKVASPHCSAINAFSQDWSDDFNLCCPPVSSIAFVIKHLEARPAQGILIIPLWPGSSFWPLITKDGVHLRSMFFKHHIFRTVFRMGVYCNKNVFNPNASHIEMMGLVFNSSRDPNLPITQSSCLNGGCNVCYWTFVCVFSLLHKDNYWSRFLLFLEISI